MGSPYAPQEGLGQGRSGYSGEKLFSDDESIAMGPIAMGSRRLLGKAVAH